MTAEDERRERYLWDPDAPPDPEVRAIEARLASARFDPGRYPLALPPLASRGVVRPSNWLRPRVRTVVALAAAAVALVAIGLGAYWSWRWSWTAGAAWAAEIENATEKKAIKTALAVGRPLELTEKSSARVDIARIGTMSVSPGSALTLAETTSTRHRVQLDRGSVSVRIWAPPGMFAFRTPAGTVRDLGCVFDLAVDANGTARVRVDTGWVQLDNDFGESLVPAGTVAEMRRLTRPSVPIYRDASDLFAAAVRAAEDGGEAVQRRELDTILRTARHRDVLTLLRLVNTFPADTRRTVLDRAVQLWPPPAGVSVEAILGGDRNQLWKWQNALDLPPVKSWWRNWKDALPWLH
jgi:FecR protein